MAGTVYHSTAVRMTEKMGESTALAPGNVCSYPHTHLSKVVSQATSNDVWCVETQERGHRLRITVSSDTERISLHTWSSPSVTGVP